LDAIADASRPLVVEVGTGSGAIAISIATERSDAKVYGVDISHRAVSWARRNGRRLRVENARFMQGSLLEPLPELIDGTVSVIVANIPFVPPREGPALAHVGPRSTVTGPSADGLELVRDLARQGSRFLEPGGRLALQLADWQWIALVDELSRLGYRQVQHLPGDPAFGVMEWRPT
jgi:release factor glutamine methyltransferase